MRKLVVNSFISLDGVMQAPGGPQEDPAGGLTHGRWGAGYFDEPMMQPMPGPSPYELLLGRGAYRVFAAHWRSSDGPITDRPNSTRKHVASRTPKQLDRDNATPISGDVPEYVTALKSENGPEIPVHGSPGLIDTLLGHYRIDELRVWIFPWSPAPASVSSATARSRSGPLQADSTVPKTGVTVNAYQRAGGIEPESFASGEPEPARGWAELGDLVQGYGGAHKW